LHHEDGSFQQYIALDADYLTLLPDDVDPKVMGPVLCAGLTAYKVCNKNRSVFGLRMCAEYPIGGFERECSAWELGCCCWGWWWAWAFGW
jgi:D-arabinose 1-dehydrogenase-like Zn-dependent alcohol dehydrogenase